VVEQPGRQGRGAFGLGYFDDVDPDDALPVPRTQIVDYWTRRQREIVAARGRLPR
jgi:hypothetical protein